tara:strand:- start:166 stop:507 length:342 start_codon:yes stop_codon:yes gene_type:complete
MAISHNITLSAGTDFYHRFSVTGSGGNAFDLSNHLVSGIVRQTYGSTGTILDLAPVTGSPTSGYIDINLSGTNTTGLAATQGIYDIQVIDKATQASRIKMVEGYFNINPTIRL